MRPARQQRGGPERTSGSPSFAGTPTKADGTPLSEIEGFEGRPHACATAWAARGEPIPCILTMMADESGGDIPVAPSPFIGDDSIGRGIVETLNASRSPAVLVRQYGPFTVGKNAKAALKAAVMCEE